MTSEQAAMLPAAHAQRLELNDEVHARPYQPLASPQSVSYLALLTQSPEREHEQVAALCDRLGCEPPSRQTSNFVAECASVRLRWERHGEFSSYTFSAPHAGAEPFSRPAIDRLPKEWIGALSGSLVVATHVEMLGAPYPGMEAVLPHFAADTLAGAELADGAAAAFTDFRIHEDGFSRFLLFDRGSMSARRAGRVVQRLLEIETYRMFALLALPLARSLGSKLASSEAELAAITDLMANAGSTDEPALLERLTRLAAAVESLIASASFRFGAARAYHGLVQQRIAELREARIPDIQTIDQFMQRRLAPAMSTCESAARRQTELAQRVARAVDLLRTRVDIVREMQNQQLLASMNRRARLQLTLQQTVEGLSIAAITYYLVGLVGYAAKAFRAAGYAVDADLATGLSLPVVALIAALGIGYVHRTVSRER